MANRRPLVQDITNETEYRTALEWREKLRRVLGDPSELGVGLDAETRQAILKGYRLHLDDLSQRIEDYERRRTEMPAQPIGADDEPATSLEAAALIATGWVSAIQVAVGLAELQHDLRAAFHDAALTNMEIAVLALHYGHDMSLGQCAKQLGVGIASTQRSLDSALDKLRGTGRIDVWLQALPF